MQVAGVKHGSPSLPEIALISNHSLAKASQSRTLRR
jgi:hypothetical protein